MEALIAPLLPLYQRERAAGRALALALVAHTSGSTYRKPGALMLIAADGAYAGLLSGGCLEGDLRGHAQDVMATGRAHLVTYTTGGSDDLLWGLGVGCEGTMQILLLRVGPHNGWQPLEQFVQAHADHRHAAAALVVSSTRPDLAAGTVLLPQGTPGAVPAPGDLQAAVQALLQQAERSGRAAGLGGSEAALRILAIPLALPPRLLLLGGGPDALPLVDIAARLAWRVTVYDHRPAYAQPERFPAAERVVLSRPEELAATLDLSRYDAAVIMSHHLPSDLLYLQALSGCHTPYVGLLGPASRRDKLLADLGPQAAGLAGRLRSPVGLNIGGRQPESIALSIIAEIHACLHGASGGPSGRWPRGPETDHE